MLTKSQCEKMNENDFENFKENHEFYSQRLLQRLRDICDDTKRLLFTEEKLPFPADIFNLKENLDLKQAKLLECLEIIKMYREIIHLTSVYFTRFCEKAEQSLPKINDVGEVLLIFYRNYFL